MFLKVKMTYNANSLLNLAETKFCKVCPALPYLFRFLQSLNLAQNLATPREIM